MFCSLILLLLCVPVVADQFLPEFWVTGTVVEYRPARFDDFVQSNDHDVTVLRVEAPAEKLGRRMMVIHDQPPPPGSIYRAKGARLRIRLQGVFWQEDGTVVADCISEVDPLP